MNAKNNVDFFEEWYGYYPDNNLKNNPVPRPQPIDFVVSFFEGMKNGIFIDVGAYDGVTWSNSLVLEKYFDWTGICIEPIIEAYEKLLKVRSSKSINSAISNFDGVTQFIKVAGYAEMLSGVASSMNKTHIDRIENEIKKFGGNKEVLNVKVESIRSILEKESIDEIDYLSIDVECGELNVLKGINWDSTNIKLISCEINEYSDRKELDSFLKDRNYRHLGRVCSDEFYSNF